MNISSGINSICIEQITAFYVCNAHTFLLIDLLQSLCIVYILANNYRISRQLILVLIIFIVLLNINLLTNLKMYPTIIIYLPCMKSIGGAYFSNKFRPPFFDVTSLHDLGKIKYILQMPSVCRGCRLNVSTMAAIKIKIGKCAHIGPYWTEKNTMTLRQNVSYFKQCLFCLYFVYYST